MPARRPLSALLIFLALTMTARPEAPLAEVETGLFRGPRNAVTERPDRPRQEPGAGEEGEEKQGELGYLLIRPTEAQVLPDRPLPLLVFLHGAGERGSDLDQVKAHGPPRHAVEAGGLPFLVLAPQCPADDWWDSKLLLGLIRKVADEEDCGPICLTGLSMGGFATWALLAAEPDLFACAVPVCGGGDPATAARFTGVPVWAFHGEDDDIVPVERTREMERALLAAGAKQLRTTYFKGVGHDSWTPAYATPGLYAWMLSHAR